VSAHVLFFGSLTGTRLTAGLQEPLPEKVWLYRVDAAAGELTFDALDSDYEVRLPLQPFHGTIGVAPAAYEVRNVLVPEAFGGNMDSPEVTAGTTVYLGVNVPGALFSLGDGHYRMGEGEVCGAAVEGAMNTVLTVELIKGVYCEWPRFEDDDSLMVAGSYRPLEDAFRIAHTQLVRWIASSTGAIDLGHLSARLADRHLARGERRGPQLHDGRQGAKALSAPRYPVDGGCPRSNASPRPGGHGIPTRRVSAPDVIVIGGGIVGTAAAVFLARAGARVTLYDREGLASGASGANSGVVQHPLDPVLVPLHLETVDLYRDLSAAEAGFGLPWNRPVCSSCRASGTSFAGSRARSPSRTRCCGPRSWRAPTCRRLNPRWPRVWRPVVS
jgi:hypothetical protein